MTVSINYLKNPCVFGVFHQNHQKRLFSRLLGIYESRRMKIMLAKSSFEIPELPDREEPEFFFRLVDFGRFLEEKCRNGAPHDLSVWPNFVWKAIAGKMLQGLKSFLKAKPGSDQIIVLQWYNSGIFVKTAAQVIGFDVIALPRYYGWPDEMGLTGLIAAAMDVLFVTHNHADHFDIDLIRECRRLNKQVFMHPGAIGADQKDIGRLLDQEAIKIDETLIKAHHGNHVWRNSPEEVATSAFEVEFSSGFRFVFCGDLDYTLGLKNVAVGPDILFITWRNPGPKFEDGHPEQTGTTIDAVNIAIEQIRPKRIILEHYGELDHIYKGFSASYDLAVYLIKNLSVKTDIFFWGEFFSLR